MKIFGERIKELRIEKGLTISQLSKEVNIGVASISRWENDKALANIEQLDILADYFGVSTDFLLGKED